MLDAAKTHAQDVATLVGKYVPVRKLFAVIAVCGFAALCALRIPEPVVDKMLEEDLRKAAEVWQTRILKQLDDGSSTFVSNALSAKDQEFLANIPNTSDVHRVTFISKRGRIFFSTRHKLIGTNHEIQALTSMRHKLHQSTDKNTRGEMFNGEVLNGETHYEVRMVSPEQVDGFQLHVSASDHFAIREVAVIDLPVFHNGSFVGTVEFQRDITVLRETFLSRMRAIISAMAIACSAFLFAIFGFVTRVNRRQIKLVEDQAEHDRSTMSDQMRMAREVRLLGELNEWLQSSRSLEELFDMVAQFMTHLLPDSEGSVYVYSNSRDVLDGHASWNGGVHKEHIHAEECWGLRRGRTYTYGQSEIDFKCAHTEPHDGRSYLCFPILAHGETVGLLHMCARSGVSSSDFMASRKLAQTSAEQISLAIANVRMRDQLQDQSVRDPLTGLFNRRHLTECLRKFISKMEKEGEPVSIISIDVDHFKKFNDNYGHDAGDMVLRAVGAAMNQFCDGDEVACRMGGEEFMLLLPQSDAAKAQEKAENLRRAVEKVSVRYGEKTLPRITISIGVAVAPDHGQMPQDLMRIADEALYSAKAAGRNQVVMAGAEMPDDHDGNHLQDNRQGEKAPTSIKDSGENLKEKTNGSSALMTSPMPNSGEQQHI